MMDFVGVNATEGGQILELNATSEPAISQEVCLIAGETISWGLDHRGRAGMDSIAVALNGVSLGRYGTPKGAWMSYGGTYTVPATGDVDFSIESVSSAGSASVGNLLDNVTIDMDAFAEFANVSFGALESDSADLPMILIAGEIKTPQTVEVIVTGGTATPGIDFTNISTVNIPTGSYDGTIGTAIPINLVIHDDVLAESSETIELRLQSASGGISFYSTTVCGGASQLTTTYTISDDDPLSERAIELTAVKEGNNASLIAEVKGELPWETVEIERSENGSDFAVISSFDNVDPHATLSGNDELPLSNTQYYYRVKAVDLLGNVYFSGIEVLTSGEQAADMELYPNPASSFVNIKFDLAGSEPAKVMITDLTGKVCYQNEMNSAVDRIDVSNLGQGVYMVSVRVNGKVKTHKKLVVSK